MRLALSDRVWACHSVSKVIRALNLAMRKSPAKYQKLILTKTRIFCGMPYLTQKERLLRSKETITWHNNLTAARDVAKK